MPQPTLNRRPRKALPPWSIAVLAAAACSDPSRVVIEASLGDRPLEGLEVAVLPFNPSRVLDSLARSASVERPDFSELEAALLSYRLQDPVRFQASLAAWLAARDSVARLSDSLSTTGSRTDPAYRREYQRFRRAYAELLRAAGQHEGAIRELVEGDLELARQAAAAADSLRTWELEALLDYPLAAERALRDTGREGYWLETDHDGSAELTLAPGDWWVLARLPHPENPFAEYRWNVPLSAAWGLPLKAPLDSLNASLKWRY